MRPRFKALSALVFSLSLASCDMAHAALRQAKHPRSTRPPATLPQTPDPHAEPLVPEPPYPNVVPIDHTGNYGAR